MFNIMVVDDEQIVIDSVRFIVKNHIRNASVCGGFRSGSAALQQISQLKPDIVLMDICMPGLNGLETIAQMKQVCPGCVFVIISAYEQFEFAKQAVELDVKEYLLKPVKRQVLVDTINRIIAELKDKQIEFTRILQAEEKLKSALAVLEPGLMYSIIMNRNTVWALEHYRELSGINVNRGYIMILKYDYENCSRKLKNTIENEPFYLIFKDILKIRRRCIMGPAMQGKTAVYIFCDDDDYACQIKSIAFAQGLLRELKKMSGIHFTIGIGGIKEDGLIAYSYEEALKALRQSNAEVTHIADVICRTGGCPDIIILDKDSQLLDSIETGDVEIVESILRDMFDKIDANNPSDDEMIRYRSKLIEIAVIAHRAALKINVEEDDYLKFNSYLKEMLDIEDSIEFEAWYIMRMVYLATKIKKTREVSTCRIISQAKSYIVENYAKHISLNTLSREFGVSPQYLCKLFKEETGVNFVEYLTEYRLEKAKEKMRNGSATIKEISYTVGFSDPNYFSRIFKKHTDISPSEYIKGG